VGKVREDYAMTSNRYGDWLASTTLRYGLGKTTTLEGHAAQLDSNSVYGLNIAKRVSATEVVSAAYATSKEGDRSGWLARIGIEHAGPVVSVAVGSRLQSPGFRQLGALPSREEVQRRTLASASVKLGSLGKLGVAGAVQTTYDNAHEDLYALTHSLSLGSTGSIATSAGYSSNNASSILFSFVHPFGNASGSPTLVGGLFELADAAKSADLLAPQTRR
jgi:outer membrane usher protein FimD/PapC